MKIFLKELPKAYIIGCSLNCKIHHRKKYNREKYKKKSVSLEKIQV